MSQTHQKRQLSSLTRQERRIEETCSEKPREGFHLNCFGSYDNTTYAEELISEFREAIAASPGEDYLRYLFAATLSRARKFDESMGIYRDLIASGGNYSDPSRIMLATNLYMAGDTASAQLALDEANAAKRASGHLPYRDRIEDLFPGSAV
jgi:hypothetical protein